MRSEKYHELTLLAALAALALNAGFGAAQLEITIAQMSDPGTFYTTIRPAMKLVTVSALLLAAFFLWGFGKTLLQD